MDLRDDLLKSTPVGWACRWGCEGLVRLFLDRGADAVQADAEPWLRRSLGGEEGTSRCARHLARTSVIEC
jgi:hypothetical protein